ncbi:alpha/beta fold hydrolase [Nocardioides dongkuii]|uniref:alpha/beta fold hydrolase n=1 Tax=Nocardioides dongkuii TaxID=2760089 RepID=UPI0015FD2EA7|nr:alpha/beta hydrolase [Nocardioides dongkuii]
MTLARRLAAAGVAGVAGLAAAGLAVGVTQRRRSIGRRDPDSTVLGSLRSPPTTVVADDGVPLHVEVDEPAEPTSPVTVVFCHGYALNLDCWHFQRAACREAGIRAVFYDQRSHGRSGRSSRENATIDHLALDLVRILDEIVPDGPVVLVGHSMGGMTVVGLVEAHPELVGDRIVGVGLIATTAGGLDPSRILFPLIPARIGGELTDGAIRTLARRHRTVDGLRRAGRSLATVVTDLFAFGDAVPASYVRFVDDMLSATPFEVVAEFFPSFRGLDKFDAVEVLGRVPASIVCGTSDRLTSIGHSRKLHDRIAGSRLLECEGAGHLVLLERHHEVDAELSRLYAAAAAGVVR